MLAMTDYDALFFRVYCVLLLASLCVSHPALRRYATYVNGDCHFGHWRYPKPASSEAKLFGVVPLPLLGKQMWEACFAALLLALAACAVTLSRATAAAATALSLFYLARVRTHGLIHNKADLVPWVLALLAASPPGQAHSHVKLLLGVVYLSSGALKLRCTGARWMHGDNLRRLTAQFVLELGQAAYDADGTTRRAHVRPLQWVLLRTPSLCAIAQPCAIAFECTFLPLAFSPPFVAFAACLLGIGFHAANLVLFDIDFVRFWLISYACFLPEAAMLLRAESESSFLAFGAFTPPPTTALAAAASRRASLFCSASPSRVYTPRPTGHSPPSISTTRTTRRTISATRASISCRLQLAASTRDKARRSRAIADRRASILPSGLLPSAPSISASWRAPASRAALARSGTRCAVTAPPMRRTT